MRFVPSKLLLFTEIKSVNYLLCSFSSDTVSFFLPLALRLANTLRPLADSIFFLKPCLFLLFLCDG